MGVVVVVLLLNSGAQSGLPQKIGLGQRITSRGPSEM
jgi:hypothetical protein